MRYPPREGFLSNTLIMNEGVCPLTDLIEPDITEDDIYACTIGLIDQGILEYSFEGKALVLTEAGEALSILVLGGALHLAPIIERKIKSKEN